MTFPARLTELIEEKSGYAEIDDIALADFLVKNAEAIRDLVVAAESVAKYPEVDKYLGSLTFNPLSEALAKLEES